MSLMRLLFTTIVLCVSVLPMNGVDAVEIKTGTSEVLRIDDFVWSDRPYIRLIGTIEPGDFKKVENYLIERQRRGDYTVGVELDSPGGNLVEAMRIGRLLRELYITTIIWGHDAPGEVQCSSACFFIFAGGIEHFVMWSERNFPFVGLHRPYYEAEDFSGLRPEEAKGVYEDVESIANAYLRDMGINSALIERMFKTSSAKVDALSWQELSSLNWMAPYYEERLIAECGALTPEESQQYSLLLWRKPFDENHPLVQKSAEISACRANLLLGDRKRALYKHSRAVRAALQTP